MCKQSSFRPSPNKIWGPTGEHPRSSPFLLCVNDLPLILENNVDLNADDTTIYASGSSVFEIEEKFQSDINRAVEWSNNNSMNIHSDKTKCTIISSRQKLKTSSKQSLDLALSFGCKIKQVDSEKCLGVYMDCHMTWSTHIEKLCKKLS